MAWGITGCGDKIDRIASLMVELKRKYNLEVDVYASKNGRMVLKWYRLWDMLKNEFSDIQVEAGANAPFLAGRLQTRNYDMLLVAPATANTVAKIAYGIADTLITNAVSQAAKAMVPTYICPSDIKKGETDTMLPSGKVMRVYIREIDVENVKRLRKMENISVLNSIEKIDSTISKFIKR